MSQAFSPTEIFKRATASTLRAIAERDDVTVGFGPEPAGVAGTRVKLPNPARDLPRSCTDCSWWIWGSCIVVITHVFLSPL